jgi:hypothetical protein
MNEEDVKSLEAAKERNKETTSTAKRALRVARETQDLAEHTLTALDGQTHKIRQLDDKLVEMKEDVKRSEGYLRYINKICVCFNCCVQDPTSKEEGKWTKDVKKLHKADGKGDQSGAGGGPTSKLGRTDSKSAQHKHIKQGKLKLVSDMTPLKVVEGGDLKEINQDFVEQDKAMDQISSIMDNLNDMSKAMGDEIEKQNTLIEGVDSKATPLKDRMKEMNTRTRLGKMHVKKESSGSVITDVGSTLMKSMN